MLHALCGVARVFLHRVGDLLGLSDGFGRCRV